MTTPAKPYSPGRTIVVGLAVAIGFAGLSLFFLFLQAQGEDARLSGEIIAVAPDSITIRAARGTETVLIIAEDAKLRGVDKVTDLAAGQHVMVKGDISEDDRFVVERLLVVKD